jgi:hypothetical protein
MSKRSIRDYIHDAFFARDKASLAAIVQDAEANGNGDGDHDEPDGDEKEAHIHLHLNDKEKAALAAATGDAALSDRVGALETGMKSIDAKLTHITDAIAKGMKDGDLPPWLKKDGDGDGDGDDDDKDKTQDEGELGGEEGAQTAQALPEAEPDLMEADPALKTGPSKMGDAAYVAAVGKALAKLVKDTRARAEILSPGFKFATIDAKPKADTAKLLCDLRRDAMTRAAATDAGKAVLGRYTADAIKGLPCAAVRLAFLDASDRMREVNNGQGRSYQTGTVDVRAFRQGQNAVLKSINQRNREFWEKQTGRPN